MDLRVIIVGECLGFVIGAQLGLVLTAVAMDVSSPGITNEGLRGFCIFGALVGGFIGAVEGYFTDGWVSLGRFREPTFGVAGGCILGLVAALLYTTIATRDPEQLTVLFTGEYRLFRWYDNPAKVRRFSLVVGVPAGSVVGGVLGMVIGRMRPGR